MGDGPFWIPLQARGRLAIMSRPRGGDCLLGDLRRLRANGVTVVDSMLEHEEARELELSTEADACTEVGLAFSSLPLPDRSVPQDAAAFWSFSRGVEAAVEHGETVVIHCRAGIGRSSLAAAAVLVLRGASPTEALATISTARGLSVPDTAQQREWFTRTARPERVWPTRRGSGRPASRPAAERPVVRQRTMFAFLHRFFGSSSVERSSLPETDIRVEAGKFSRASPADSAAARTTEAYQGPFEPLFRQAPDYLTLLGLGPEARPALQFIVDVVRENPKYRQSVLELLADPGWRLPLVAAVAVLFSRNRIDLCPALWEAMDRGSWVAPQLGVVLSICDPKFVAHAKQRIVRGCPVAPANIPSELERHVIAGSGGPSQRSARNLATLLHLVHAIPGEFEWADATSQAPDLHQLLRTDRDQCDRLAARWTAALRDRLTELGPPVQDLAV